METLYPDAEVRGIAWQLRELRKHSTNDAAEAFRDKFFRRMWDLSQFMKTLKQRFTRWFNRTHGRRGTLWEERFKSVLVEDGHAARTMAAYIDLNPVRAGIVEDPKDYRWCGYAEAVAGKERAREGLQRVMFEEEAAVNSEELALGFLLSWRRTAYRYRQILHMDRSRDDAGTESLKGEAIDRGRGLAVPRALFRGRSRHWLEALRRPSLSPDAGEVWREALGGCAEVETHRLLDLHLTRPATRGGGVRDYSALHQKQRWRVTKRPILLCAVLLHEPLGTLNLGARFEAALAAGADPSHGVSALGE